VRVESSHIKIAQFPVKSQDIVRALLVERRGKSFEARRSKMRSRQNSVPSRTQRDRRYVCFQATTLASNYTPERLPIPCGTCITGCFSTALFRFSITFCKSAHWPTVFRKNLHFQHGPIFLMAFALALAILCSGP
jgi:hypothetical protein